MSRISSLFQLRKFPEGIVYQKPVVKSSAMPNVLVIDNSATTRMFYRETLESAGLRVDEALNGLEGLEKTMRRRSICHRRHQHAEDGRARIPRELGGASEIRGLPAIVISTQQRAQDRASAHAAGANAYVVKPIDPQALVAYGRLMTGADSGPS